MTRSHAREIAVHQTFALAFGAGCAEELLEHAMTRENFERLKDEVELYKEFPNERQRLYINQLVKGVRDHDVELDSYIEKYAIGWAFSRISRTAAAIMRVAMYEIMYMPDIPAAASINEAVEITKSYEVPETTAFVNGILGAFLRGEMPPEPEMSAKSVVETEGK